MSATEPGRTRRSSRAAKRPPMSSSVSAPPRTSARKRPVSLHSQRSDGRESDLTTLSDSTHSPPAEAKPISRKPLSTDTLSYVWVLVDFEGIVLGEQDESEQVWWPGVVESSSSQILRVKLFGAIGTSQPDTVVAVKTPHPGNIMRISIEEAIRFTEPEFVTPPHFVSPKKRQKLDTDGLKKQWQDALSRLVSDIDENELPNVAFLSSVRNVERVAVPSLRAQAKGKARAISIADDEEGPVVSDADSDLRWSPPPADDSLSIPGELILARARKGKQYWPAQILAYEAPSTSKQRPLYKIMFLDNSKESIARESFYTFDEEGFGTCEVGKFESQFAEVVNDVDGDEDLGVCTKERLQRSLSPAPLDPPPDKDAFCNLNVRQQFVHAKPVLQAILRDEYPPAREAHRMFMAGGKQRHGLNASAGERGLMDPRDLEGFQRCLVEWVMRRMTRAQDDEEMDEASGVPAPVDEDTTRVPPPRAQNAEADEEMKEAFDMDLRADADIVGVAGADAALAAAELPPIGSDPVSDEISSAANNLVVQVRVEDTEPPVCAPSSPTTTVRDSSPIPLPPSSSFSTLEASMVEERSVGGEPPSVPCGPDPGDGMDDLADQTFDTASILTDASDISDLVPPVKPPRQIGCADYERLSTGEKLSYCVNVLLPELVIQMFVWRMGERNSVALLPPKKEQELHDLGTKEKKRTDWVWDVKRLRKQKEKNLKDELTETVVGGTASRPKTVLTRTR